ncbi:UNVERIFIED_ORG: hypothetical protein B2H93_04415 [Clostridium botulinum]
MQYFLNKNSNNNYENLEVLTENILNTYGIKDANKYLNPTKDCEYSYKLLGNIDKAVKCLLKHIKNGDVIYSPTDSDTDGNCANSMLINYLRTSFDKINIKWDIHIGKQHGLTNDLNIPDNTKLIIVTDGGSSDYQQHKYWYDKGVDIIILDHHECEIESKYAIVVNNQLYDYPNKSLCGAGVVYKFLQALDDELWQSKADNYLDLVALAEIGDSMNITNLETKYYIQKGLSQIKNKQLKALLSKQEYSTKGVVNINNIAFYITPLINAMIRVGKQDEKELMMKGFLEEFEEFDYKPRGNKPIEKEDIYTRVARLSSNAKSRQNKLRDKALQELEEIIHKKNKLNDKVMVINCENKYNLNLTGVIAIKLADKFNRPCILLNKSKDGTYRGSARNTDRNPIKDLKQIVNSTKIIEGIGHAQAHGVNIIGSVPKAIQKLNNILKDIEFKDNVYEVIFDIPFENLEDEFINQIDLLKNIWGRGLEEPLIAIKNIEVKANEIEVIGKKTNTLKFVIDGVEFVKFNIDDKDVLVKETSNWEDNCNKCFTINVIGNCSINNFNGSQKPQIKIKDYEIKNIKAE